MVDVSVSTPELALSEQPRTQIDSAVFNRPLQVGISSGLEQLGAGAGDLATDLAKTKAADDVKNMAVTLDASGQPQVATPDNSIILGQAGQQYQQAFMQGEKARLSSVVTDRLSAIHLANETDPAGFHAASQAFVEGLRNNTTYGPEVGNALADQASNEASQRFANISEKNFELDTRAGEQAIQTNIADGENRLKAMARQGAVGTDAYMIQQAQLMDSYDALGSNKLFGYSPEKIESLKNTAISDLNAQYVIGQVDAVFTKKGRAEAEQVLQTSILNNPDLDLGDADRRELYTWGRAHLDSLTAEQKAQADANNIALTATGDALRKDPTSVPPAVVSQIITQAKSVGNPQGAAQLEAVVATLPFHRNTNGLSPEQSFNAGMGSGSDGNSGSEQQALTYFQSKGWSPAQAAGIVGNLVRESGLRTGAVNPGDGSDGSDSIGLGQWNGSRAAALKQFAAQQGKSVNDFGTQLAFVQHELETTEGAAAGQLRLATNARDAASAFALGYERPQGFMTGDMTKVAGGNDRVAAAVRLAGGGASNVPTAGPSANGIPFSPAQISANPYLASEYVKTLATNQANVERLGTTIGEGLRVQAAAGNPVNPTTYANLLQAAQLYPEKLGPIVEKVQAAVTANDTLTKARGQGAPGDAQALVDQAQQIATTQPSIMHSQIADAFQAANKRQTEALKTTPWEEGARLGWFRQPTQFDFSTPQGVAALPQAMQEHGVAAAVVGSRTLNASISALSPTELPMIKSVMTNGTLDQRTALLGAIANAGMTEPVLKATLGELGKSEETMPLAVAGSIAKDDPGTARGIVEGQALRLTEPKLAPNKDDFPGEFARALPFNDFPQTAVRQGLDSAVQSYYAKLSASAGDATGVLNSARLKAAIDGVTGGIVEHRGSSIIAPWRGASKDDTDAAIRLVSDADLANSRGSDGIPLPASALKPSYSSAFGFGGNWRLESTGDGKYLVFSGADDKRQYLGASNGGKFVLDLGAKRGQVAASIGRFQPDSFYSGLAQTATQPGSNIQ